jgi:TorA maturation chaperone TorD
MSKKSGTSYRSRIARGRSHVYHLLATLYLREVNPELLRSLSDDQMIRKFKKLGVDLFPILSHTPQKELLDDLAQEYTALFIAPGGTHPYESVQLRGLLCQEPTSQVDLFYKKCGLVIKEDCSIFPDHLGLELEFMGYLADKESSALENNVEKNALDWCNLQKEFFSHHISRWAFNFLQDVDNYAFHPFYKVMARLTMKFLEIEKNHFDQAVESPISDGGNVAMG